MGFTVPDLHPVPESQIFFTTCEVKHASQREGDRTEKPKKVAKGKAATTKGKGKRKGRGKGRKKELNGTSGGGLYTKNVKRPLR